MKTTEIEVGDKSLKLIAPDVERDAELGVEWLNGELGRKTMLLMGNSEETLDAILPTNIDAQTQKIKEFAESPDQLNWMIQYEGNVVGTTWVNLVESPELSAPSVHIMIGDPAMRGKGIGIATIDAVLDYLDKQGYTLIYSRHIVTNEHADGLLKSLGFKDLGEPYTSGGVQYQNLARETVIT